MYIKTQKKHYWVNEAYFSNPKNALRYIVDHEIRATGFDKFETIVKKVNELYRLIDGLKPLPKPVQSILEG